MFAVKFNKRIYNDLRIVLPETKGQDWSFVRTYKISGLDVLIGGNGYKC